MHKLFWKELSEQGPIAALAPMDGYTDSPYRQVVKKIAPNTVVFSEFFSADGLVHSKELQKKALSHDPSEYPLVIQIFGKDPNMFREAAKIIESYGITGIDINMGCPAKKVVKSGHGSSLMINRETAFRIVEEMANAVEIPISVKTRLGWEDDALLLEFCQGLQNAGANLISVHGRTYKQAFKGNADFAGIYKLKQHLDIPVLANGDILDYDDGVEKIVHPKNREKFAATVNSNQSGLLGDIGNNINTVNSDNRLLQTDYFHDLDGFMIGRASFGNPWCFLPGSYKPMLREILSVIRLHGDLLWQCKERKGMMEARKHLVQYLHGFPGVKEYRTALVHVEKPEDIHGILEKIATEHPALLDIPMNTQDSHVFDIECDC